MPAIYGGALKRTPTKPRLEVSGLEGRYLADDVEVLEFSRCGRQLLVDPCDAPWGPRRLEPVQQLIHGTLGAFRDDGDRTLFVIPDRSGGGELVRLHSGPVAETDALHHALDAGGEPDIRPRPGRLPISHGPNVGLDRLDHQTPGSTTRRQAQPATGFSDVIIFLME